MRTSPRLGAALQELLAAATDAGAPNGVAIVTSIEGKPMVAFFHAVEPPEVDLAATLHEQRIDGEGPFPVVLSKKSGPPYRLTVTASSPDADDMSFEDSLMLTIETEVAADPMAVLRDALDAYDLAKVHSWLAHSQNDPERDAVVEAARALTGGGITVEEES